MTGVVELLPKTRLKARHQWRTTQWWVAVRSKCGIFLISQGFCMWFLKVFDSPGLFVY